MPTQEEEAAQQQAKKAKKQAKPAALVDFGDDEDVEEEEEADNGRRPEDEDEKEYAGKIGERRRQGSGGGRLRPCGQHRPCSAHPHLLRRGLDHSTGTTARRRAQQERAAELAERAEEAPQPEADGEEEGALEVTDADRAFIDDDGVEEEARVDFGEDDEVRGARCGAEQRLGRRARTGLMSRRRVLVPRHAAAAGPANRPSATGLSVCAGWGV